MLKEKDCKRCWYKEICTKHIRCDEYVDRDDGGELDGLSDADLLYIDDDTESEIEIGRLEFDKEWFKYTDEENV